MQSLTNPSYQKSPQANADMLAVLSGENIYIVYPNGAVEAIAFALLDRLQNKKLLANCLVWGDLATL
ncbi:MAG TPA: hypothetical protein IGS52_16485 [Oscillatoriaceae cyanobacterium M33_DOE_052]|uniref:Uncharacterized protein n=1 Tax=Planktothricoides sp. SpSt-374 TaxID=2282167 RepID=A0A7C3ZM74_9CYAN|nr:hypothetical protein [Oscillatoriaceae cyanobacterium M33_DOE_052]